MSSSLSSRHGARGRSGGRLLGVVGALLVVQAILVFAFVYPGHKPEPHDVPIAVVGPAALGDQLEAKRPGAFDVKAYDSESEARRAIENRDVYGALVAEGGERRVLVASAASAPIANSLRSALAEGSQNVTVSDVKPLDPDDPTGATLNLMFLPLVVVCLPAVLLLSSLGLSARGMIGAVTLFAALGGLAVVGLVAEGLGALPGSYLELSAIAGLAILAIAMTIAGFERLLGHAGIALGFLTFFLIGNPASGNASAPELLPGFWRQISQYMPNGAGGTGLRNTAYFDGNAVLEPLLVLGAYAAVGALLVVAGEAVRRRRHRLVEVAEPAEIGARAA
jgi:hypothetical protein